MLDVLLEALEAHGCEPRRGQAKCPSHDDRVSSLSYGERDKAPVLACHAGCAPDEVIQALGLVWADLYEPPVSTNVDKRIVATYDYTDEADMLLYQVVRWSPKGFSQRQPNPGGDTWFWNLQGVVRVPYRLPDLLKAVKAGRWVLLTEGEKDADALRALGFASTTTAGGAGSWDPALASFFRDAQVCCLPDNDDPGRAYMARVAADLQGIASDVRVLTLPVALKGDVTDWLVAGGTADALKTLVTACESSGASPGRLAPGLMVIRASEVVPEDLTWFWEGRVPYGAIALIDGHPGQGKSTLSLALVARASTEGVTSILLSAEDSLSNTIVPRLMAHEADLTKVLSVASVTPLDAPERPWQLPDDLPYLRELIVNTGARLVVIDPLASFLSAAHNMNNDQHVRRALHPLATLAQETGAAILCVRHLRKSREEGPALVQGGGSIGIIGAARAGLLVASDPHNPDLHVVAVTKLNLGQPGPALAFRLETDDKYGCAKVVWCGTSPHTAETLLAHVDEDTVEDVGLAADFLKRILNRDEVPVPDVLRLCRAQGITDKNLARARRMMGVYVVTGAKELLWGMPDGTR